MAISTILILSSKYEQLLIKDYRWDTGDTDVLGIVKQKVKTEGLKKPPPLFEEEGLIIHTLSQDGVIFVAVIRKDGKSQSVFSTFKILEQMAQICKDFCGCLSDEAIELNVPLVLELLDEMIDYGFSQSTSTNRIQPYIQSNPVLPRVEKDIFDLPTPALFGVDSRTVPNTAAEKPLLKTASSQGSSRNDVFMNVIETLSAVLKTDGSIVRCEVNGVLSMKCFLAGSPEIKLGLNSDLVVEDKHRHDGTDDIDSYNPQLRLTKCTFHKSLNMHSFPANRTMKFGPTDGEINLIQYQVKGDIMSRLPFKMYTTITASPQHKCVDLSVTIYCDISNSGHAVNLQVTIPVPGVTTSVHCGPMTTGQNAEFRQSSNTILWNVDRIDSKTEVTRKFKIYMESCDVSKAKDVLKLINLSFEIPDHVISPLRIKFLHIFTRDSTYTPHRWIRYVTYSESYTQRLG